MPNLYGQLWRMCLALLLGLLISPAQAQPDTRCKPRYPAPEMQAATYDMAALTAETLDSLDNIEVLIAARSGQDLSRFGLRHSHLAFLLRDGTGSWQVLHLLNRCKSDSSSLYREGLINFIGESAQNPAGLRIGIPNLPLRTAIAQLLAGPALQARALHQPHYSAVAYPWRTQYQNSNQWVLEIIAAAMAQVNDGTVLDNRTASTSWLKQHDYIPSRLHIGLGKRLGARFFAKNVAVTDHPGSERISGNYSVVTVESIFDFLHRKGALEREITLALPPPQQPVPPSTSINPQPSEGSP